MKKVLLSIALIGSFTGVVNAQQTSDEATKNVDGGVLAKSDTSAENQGWIKGGVFGVNFGQVHLDNWQGGGLSSVSVNSIASLFANYKRGMSAWDNSLDLAYGLINQDKAGFIKSDDRIELNSKYGRQFKNNKKWYYGGLVNFRTQFAPGYETADKLNFVSDILSPAYLTAALGFDYKPSPFLSIFIAPASYRGTIVMDRRLNSVGTYGVDTNKNMRHEMGGLFMAKFQKDLDKDKRINLKTQVTLFSNYFDRPENIDILWDVLLSMKVNKYITANISATWIYDHDIDIPTDENNDGVYDVVGPKGQFKEVLNIGFSYKF